MSDKPVDKFRDSGLEMAKSIDMLWIEMCTALTQIHDTSDLRFLEACLDAFEGSMMATLREIIRMRDQLQVELQSAEDKEAFVESVMNDLDRL